MKDLQEGIWANANSSFFFNICRDNYKQYDECTHKLLEIENDNHRTQDRLNHKLKRLKCGPVVIVFAAMSLEAFIYQYAASRKGKSYAKKLDNEPHIERWKKIPQDVTGRKIPEDSEGFVLLEKLIKARKDLIHSKSFFLPENKYDEHIKGKLKEEQEDDKRVRDAYRTVRLVFTELRKIDDSVDRDVQWAFVGQGASKAEVETQNQKVSRS